MSFHIYSGSNAGALTVEKRSITNPEQSAWSTEESVMDEYRAQKLRYPHMLLVVIERISFGNNRLVIDDRKQPENNSSNLKTTEV